MHIKAIAAAHALPIAVAYAAALPYVCRAAPAAVVLQATHHVVGQRIVHGNMVQLAQGQFFVELPSAATVAANGNAAVVAVDDKIGIGGVYPPRVVIGVHAAVGYDDSKRLAAIVALGNHLVNIVEAVFVLRIYADVLKVKRTVGDPLRVFVHLQPLKATVVAAIERIFFGFYHGVHHFGIVRSNGQTHPAGTVGG